MSEVIYTENPLRAGLRIDRNPEPCTLAIFGVTGDLAARKLLPSLYRLYVDGYLPAGFSVVGFARRDWDDETFRTKMRDTLEENLGGSFREEAWEGFADALFFCPGKGGDEDSYERLDRVLARVDEERVHTGNRLFYLAVPPSLYASVIEGVGGAGLTDTQDRPGWARIIVEKPFGSDLATARRLNDQLQHWFHEEQIYRIDHYLGKETVQNILVFRLANGIFEPVWNRQYVDHVQITVAEDVGVGGRTAYYEETGALRDMIQNHVLQLLALVAMEPPVSFDADAVRDEKAKVLQALRPLRGKEVDENAARGQFAAGLSHGEAVEGYRELEGVSPHSQTETFVALRAFIDTWRWAGVPFYLRTGKRLPKRVTEIALQFKQPPLLLFGERASELEANVLAMNIQPDEGITLKFGSKLPGRDVHVHPVHMDFRYGSSFGVRAADAYERLLLDSMLGDPTRFTRDDGVEAAWRWVDGIVARWRSPDAPPVSTYEAGGWGPQSAEELVDRDGREWRRL